MVRKMALIISTVILLTFTVACVVSAEELTGPTPRFTYIDYVSTTFDIQGGVAEAGGLISPRGNRHSWIAVKLQRLEDGIWKTKKIWYGENENGTCSAGGNYTLTSGYNYRVQVNGRVFDENGDILEAHYMNSQTKYY